MKMCLGLIFLVMFSIKGFCAQNYHMTMTVINSDIYATYKFERPIKKVVFTSEPERQVWQLDNDFQKVSQGNHYVLSTKNGKVFTGLTIKIPAVYTPSGGYAQIVTFKDGGVSVYSGYFRPQYLVASNNTKEKASGLFDFVASGNDNNVIIRQGIQGKSIHNYKIHKDFYTYFGKAKLVSFGNFDYVIDSSFPVSVMDKLVALINHVFQLDEKLTAQTINQRVIVFLEFHPTQDPINFTGDVTNYQINLNFYGKFNPQQPLTDKFLYLIAHELFHLWNAEKFEHTGPSWIHEGSADYFSYYTLHQLKYIDDEQYKSAIQFALNKCASRVGIYPIVDSWKYSDNDMTYGCGAVVHYSIDRECGDGCAAKLWKNLYADASQVHSYSQDTWLKALEQTVKDKVFNQELYHLIMKPITSDDLPTVLKKLNWDLQWKDRTEKQNRFLTTLGMVTDLVDSECSDYRNISVLFNKRYIDESDEFKFELKGLHDCKTEGIKSGLITKIDGEWAGTSPLYRQIKRKCEHGKVITFTYEDGSVVPFTCHAKLKALPNYVVLK
jgi:hypothetical protein